MDNFQRSAESLALPKSPQSTLRKILLGILLFPGSGLVCCAGIDKLKEKPPVVQKAQDGGVKPFYSTMEKENNTSWYYSPKNIEARNQKVIDYFTENMRQLMHVDPKDFRMDQPYHKPFTVDGVEFVFSFIFHVEEGVLEVKLQLLGPPADNRLDLKNTVQIPLKRDHLKKTLLEVPDDIPETKI